MAHPIHSAILWSVDRMLYFIAQEALEMLCQDIVTVISFNAHGLTWALRMYRHINIQGGLEC